MSIFISQKPLQISVDRFINGEESKLLVVGLSGSGKTTISKLLAEKYQAKYVNLDSFFFSNQKLKESDPHEYRKRQSLFELEVLTNNERLVIDGVALMRMSEELTMHLPVIILRISLIQASWRGLKRNLSDQLTNRSQFNDGLTSLNKNWRKYFKELNKFVESRLKFANQSRELVVEKTLNLHPNFLP